MECGVCGREVREDEVYAQYPEDSSCICRQCFGAGMPVEEEHAAVP